MAGSAKADTSAPSGDTPMLARLTDGRNIAIFNWAKANLPDAEWFEVDCDDEGRIVLTPAKDVPAEAYAWAQQRDVIAAAQKPRPYAHLTTDELRDVEMTQEERLAELVARGVISPNKKVPGQLSVKPVARVPGALERFLKERRGEA